MEALMGLPVISILTHDSIGVGEDGPTHQPIEHLAMLRSLPNYNVFRPCDTRETAAAWYTALHSKETPTALILSRQNLPALEGTGKDALKGAYVLKDCAGTPDVLLMASGSEVELIYKAADELAAKGVKARRYLRHRMRRIRKVYCLRMCEQDWLWKRRLTSAGRDIPVWMAT